MIRLAVSVEGQTEEEFVKNVIADHLRTKCVEPWPILLNGNITIEGLAWEMANQIQTRGVNRVTSLVDFYGFRDHNAATPQQLERLIHKAVDKKINRSWNQSYVIPYVQQHEFEGLLFSDVNAFAQLIDVSCDDVQKLRAIRSQFPTPENINNNSTTAPSKRIKQVIRRYKKTVDGPLLALEIGLNKIRSECPRFNDWMTKLESLGCCN